MWHSFESWRGNSRLSVFLGGDTQSVRFSRLFSSSTPPAVSNGSCSCLSEAESDECSSRAGFNGFARSVSRPLCSPVSLSSSPCSSTSSFAVSPALRGQLDFSFSVPLVCWVLSDTEKSKSLICSSTLVCESRYLRSWVLDLKILPWGLREQQQLIHSLYIYTQCQ